MAPDSRVEFVGHKVSADASALRIQAPATVIIFGATGDLTGRKLIPALFNLHRHGFLPKLFNVVGVARREFTDESFRDLVKDGARKHSRDADFTDEQWSDFASMIHYYQLRFDDTEGYPGLGEYLDKLEKDADQSAHRVFYLATEPNFFLPITHSLAKAGMIAVCHSKPCPRVVIEKPFGHNLASATELNQGVLSVLEEDQIYRIDHYLGKETVLNILSFRFGNAIFESLFSNNHVNSVQITVAESIGMEGRRGPYYDGSGALRDVIQNHGLQLLCLVAMEPPALFGHKEIRDEKVKVLRSLRPWTQERLKSETVRGQYVAGSIGEKPRPPFRSEEGVDPKSMTETFVGMRTFVDNWRWSGVPFLLRTGKCLPKRSTEIAIEFKQPPLQLFTTVECEGEVCDITQARPNVLVFRIQPDEGISLSFSAKRPGMLFQIHPVEMDFIYNQSFKVSLPEAYERLLLDAMRDDSTLFTRSDEVEAAWEFCEPMLQAWASNDPPPLYFYEAGTWGPHEADQLWAGYSGGWRNR